MGFVAGFLAHCAQVRTPLVLQHVGNTPRRANPPSAKSNSNSSGLSSGVATYPDLIKASTRRLLTELPGLLPENTTAPNEKLITKMAEFLKASDESRRTLHFSLLLEMMRPNDAPKVAAMFEALKREGLEFHPEANFFAQRWREVDSDAALSYVADQDQWERNAILLDRVMSGWASQSGPEAIEWVNDQADSPLKDKAIEGLATGMGRTDPDGATRFMLELQEGPARSAAANTIFWQIMYQSGLDAATHWYDSLSPTEREIRKMVLPAFEARQRLRQNEAATQWVAERVREFEVMPVEKGVEEKPPEN